MTIKKGDKFKCIRWNGTFFTTGKTYISPSDGVLLDNNGEEQVYGIDLDGRFEKIEETPYTTTRDWEVKTTGNDFDIRYNCGNPLCNCSGRCGDTDYVPFDLRGCTSDECCEKSEYKGIKPSKTKHSEAIETTFENLHDLLQYKNQKYGSSGLHPINVFSKTNAETGLLQRLDDKVARIQNSKELRKNDVADLVGYLILLCVSKGWTSFEEFKD